MSTFKVNLFAIVIALLLIPALAGANTCGDVLVDASADSSSDFQPPRPILGKKLRRLAPGFINQHTYQITRATGYYNGFYADGLNIQVSQSAKIITIWIQLANLEQIPVKIIYPEGSFWEQHEQNMIDAVLKLPFSPKLRSLYEVVFNPGAAGFTAADGGKAAGAVYNGDPRIHIYSDASSFRSPRYSFSAMELLTHEFAHRAIYFLTRSSTPSSKYIRAAHSDAYAISEYGKTNWAEDFAEAFMKYFSSIHNGTHAEKRQYFSGRFAFLDEMFSEFQDLVDSSLGKEMDSEAPILARRKFTPEVRSLESLNLEVKESSGTSNLYDGRKSSLARWDSITRELVDKDTQRTVLRIVAPIPRSSLSQRLGLGSSTGTGWDSYLNEVQESASWLPVPQEGEPPHIINLQPLMQRDAHGYKSGQIDLFFDATGWLKSATLGEKRVRLLEAYAHKVINQRESKKNPDEYISALTRDNRASLKEPPRTGGEVRSLFAKRLATYLHSVQNKMHTIKRHKWPHQWYFFDQWYFESDPFLEEEVTEQEIAEEETTEQEEVIEDEEVVAEETQPEGEFLKDGSIKASVALTLEGSTLSGFYYTKDGEFVGKYDVSPRGSTFAAGETMVAKKFRNQGFATYFFSQALAASSDRVTTLEDQFSDVGHSVNYEVFIEHLAEGKSPEEALMETPYYKIRKKFGFTKIEELSIDALDRGVVLIVLSRD